MTWGGIFARIGVPGEPSFDHEIPALAPRDTPCFFSLDTQSPETLPSASLLWGGHEIPMPFHGAPIESNTILETRLVGRVTDEELLAYYQAILDDLPARWLGHELVDGTDVTEFAITNDGYRRLIELLGPRLPELAGSRVAMVAPSDIVFGMFRKWELQRADLDYEVRVFRLRADAMAWLRHQLMGCGNGA